MKNSASDRTNIINLQHLAGEAAAKNPTALGVDPAPPDANDRYVADSLQLVSSFMLIEDNEMRASIIRLVEKIAEQGSIFKK